MQKTTFRTHCLFICFYYSWLLDLHTSAASEINAWVDYVLMEYFIFISWCVCVCVRALACTNVRYMYVSYIAGLKKMPIRICNRKKYSSNLCLSLNKPRHCVCLSLKYFFHPPNACLCQCPSLYSSIHLLKSFLSFKILQCPSASSSKPSPEHVCSLASS